MWLIALGVLVHLVFLKSIFDVYFVSPLVHGMTPQPILLRPPAKRLVLVSCDGLRADKFFERDVDGFFRMPFLKQMAELGTQGVSSTRVPTESRPGHVAMIGGFYEDVSAVTKGWKDNPVDFDSVFNQSRFTWAWGSPDIVPIFTRVKTSAGDLHQISHIFPYTYTTEFEDFAASPIETDFWVFDRFTEFAGSTEKDLALKEKLNSDRVVLFFHLLGMDTTGHTHKPQSKLYDENMRRIDERMQTLVDQVETLFDHDNQTAFLFTSDHGMTDWGSHGSGQVEEIATPLVAWGAGIARNGEDINIEQADLTPLMSVLLGQSIPVHSVGVLPLAYLDASVTYKKTAALINIKQIFEQVRVKRDQKRSESFTWMFQPFTKMDEVTLKGSLQALENAINEPSDQTAEEMLASLIHIGLETLAYYQQYDRNYLRFLVVLCYGGWMALCLLLLLEGSSKYTVQRAQMYPKRLFIAGGVGVNVAVAALLAAQNSPWFHYLYALLPVPLWTVVLYKVMARGFLREQNRSRSLYSMLLPAATFLLSSEILILTFFYRPAVSLGMAVSGLWTYAMAGHLPKKLRLVWLSTSLLVAIFPLLPVVGSSRNHYLVISAGLLSAVASGSLMWNDRKTLQRDPQGFKTGVSQIGVVLLSMVLVKITANRVDAFASPGMTVHLTSWLICGIGFFLPFLGSSLLLWRYISIACSLMASYLLMSVSHEAMFLLTLIVQCYIWIVVETHTAAKRTALRNISIFDIPPDSASSEARQPNLDDARRAFLYLLFILTSFYGTGNIASINSFDPASAFCFVTVFRPFIMGLILMCKVAIPFLIVGCAFHIIQAVCRVPMESMSLILTLFTDFMALHFFFLVKTEGSWLDIGTTISHYAMVMTLILFTKVLSFTSSLLMSKHVRLIELKRYFLRHTFK